MAKAKKAFFTPARNQDWYLGRTNDEAAKIVGKEGTGNGSPLYHVAGPVRAELGPAFAAPDNYNLIHRVAAASKGARRDLAGVVTAHMLADPKRTEAMMREVAEGLDDLSETLWSYAEMRADVETELTVEAPSIDNAASEAEAQLATAILKADKARERLFAEGMEKNFQGTDLRHEVYYLDRLKPAAEAFGDFAASLRQGIKHRQAGDTLIQTLSTRLAPDTLVRLADTMPVHYGGKDHWLDGPTPNEAEARLNAVDLAMRHWDEVNVNQQFPGGISVNNGRLRALPAAVVEEKGVRVTDQADFEAVTSKPKAPAAPAASVRKPGS